MSAKVVLLVEDNPDDEALAIRALQQNNIVSNIVVVRDGAEVLDYLFAQGNYADRDTSEIPQLILLDIKLPKIDGLEVLRRLRADERTKLIPIVIMTTSDEEQDRIKSYTYHANSFIRKPVDFKTFKEVIQQIAMYWLILNEPPPLGD